MRKLLIGGMLTVVLSVGAAGPAFAFDCFNPNKKIGAGSSGTLVLDAQGNAVSFTQTKNGNGGFFTVDARALGVPGVDFVDLHGLGSGHNPHGVVGGPGSQKPGHACDGKGIDYASACFGGG